MAYKRESVSSCNGDRQPFREDATTDVLPRDIETIGGHQSDPLQWHGCDCPRSTRPFSTSYGEGNCCSLIDLDLDLLRFLAHFPPLHQVAGGQGPEK